MVTTYTCSRTKEMLERAMMSANGNNYYEAVKGTDDATMMSMEKVSSPGVGLTVKKIALVHRVSEKMKMTISNYWNCLCVLASAMLFVPIAGLILNYNLISVCLKEEFKSDAVITGWIGSAAISFLVIASPVGAYLFKRFSYRPIMLIGIVVCSVGCLATSYVPSTATMFVSYSISLGVGGNLVQFTSYNYVLAIYKNEKCALATGVVSLGVAVGMMVFPAILDVFLINFGWRGTFRIMSIIILVNGLVCCVFLTSPSQSVNMATDTKMEKKPDPVKEVIEPIKHESFTRAYATLMAELDTWLIIIAFLFLGTAVVFFYIDLIGYLHSVGFDDDDGALFLTVIGGTELGSRLLCTLLGDHLPLSVSSTYGLASLLGAVPPVVLPFVANNFAGVLICIIVVSATRAVYNTLWFPLCVEIYPTSKIAIGCTFMSVSFGIGNLLGSVIGGLLYDITNSYKPSIYLCGGLHVVVALLLMVLWYRGRKRCSMLWNTKEHRINYLGSILSLSTLYQPCVESDKYILEHIVTTV